MFYVLPRLPASLVEEGRKSSETFKQLKDLEKKNAEMAERLLAAGQKRLIDMGFTAKTVEAVFRNIEVGIARDIVNWSEKKRADAVILSTRGRSKLVTFFLGEIANKVLEYSRVCPVWMVKGTVKKRHALFAIDNSKNALRAVDHAGFMLSGTDVKVTIFHSKRDLSRFIPGALVEEFPEFQKHWLRKAGKEIAPFMQKAKDMLLAAGLRDGQITTKVVDGSRSAAVEILKEAQRVAAGSIFLGSARLFQRKRIHNGRRYAQSFESCRGYGRVYRALKISDIYPLPHASRAWKSTYPLNSMDGLDLLSI